MNDTLTDREAVQIPDLPDGVTHPMIQFAEALDQLLEEHELLRSKLQEFAVIHEVIHVGKPNLDWFGTLRDLKVRVESFLTTLAAHADMEDRTLFPIVALYADEHAETAEVLEADHRLAVQYLNAFLEELRHCVAPIHQACAIRIIELLMNAHGLLLEHFRAEERYVFPIANQILEDIDYLSC